VRDLTETGKLLALIRTGDNRTVDQATIAFWHDVVGDLDLGDALEAVRRHRRASADYLLPAHVRAGVRGIRGERLTACPDPPPLADPDDARQYRLEKAHLRELIASGRVDPADSGAWERARVEATRVAGLVGATAPRRQIGA
jgi:hypothetical protein